MEEQRTELGFLMDLFLDDEVPKAIKIKIAGRMKEIESIPRQIVSRGTGSNSIDPHFLVPVQAPSMQRLIQNNPDLVKPPTPVTQAAALALQERQEAILNAGKEKPDKGRTSPRKF